ncbi:hypothetical protein K440DRAFT_578562, partial [Wilcoxina mikolae CBS 423.85]
MTDTPQLDGANGSRPRYPDPNEYLHGLVDIGRCVTTPSPPHCAILTHPAMASASRSPTSL